MDVRRKFSRGQRRQFPYLFHGADDAIQIDIHKTLFPSTPQRKRPLLRYESEKCVSLAEIA